MSLSSGFLLGDWQVSPPENRLSKDKLSLTVEPKAMDVLVYLATHAGEVVSADRLLSACWNSRFLGDNPIYKVIAQLRKALGDTSTHPSYILTIPKRGYQLIEQVCWLEEQQRTSVDQVKSWLNGSPFRGLQFFDQEHSEIFFGRARAKAEIIQHLRRAIENDSGFVLLLGKSGCGKSSLLRAGIIPLLTQANGSDGVAVSGTAILMPLELTDHHYSRALLKLLFKHHVFPVSCENKPLDSIQDCEGICKRLIQRNVCPKKPFLLIIDQLEIILNQYKQSAVELDDFIACLDLLVRSGTVLLICAMRNDYYSVFMEFELLERLKNDGEQYDLNTPTPAEIAQMIRRPAQAARLKFEKLPVTEEKLDDMILTDAVRNLDVLPMLQYSLQQLYQHRDPEGEMQISTYREMGGLFGALANQAERIFSGLPESVQAQFPRLLHFLIRLGVDGSSQVTRQPMNLEQIWNDDCRQLVNAFVGARLMIIELQNRTEQLLITHDALVYHWPRIQQWQEQNQQTLKSRARLLETSRRWENEHRSGDFLLADGKPLQEAQGLLEVPDIYLSAGEKSLIIASGNRVRRFNYFKRAVFCGCVVLGITAAIAAYNANIAGKAADHSRAQADDLISFMLGDLRHRLQEVGRLDILDQIGTKVTAYITNIGGNRLSVDAQLQHIQALKLIGEIRLAQAKNDDALESFNSAYQQTSKLQREFGKQEKLLAASSELSYWIGYIHYLRGDLAQTEQFWQQYYRGTMELVKMDDSRVNWWLELSYALNNLGTLSSSNGNISQAIQQFQQSIKWKHKVLAAWPSDENVLLELADSHSWLGSTYQRLGQLSQAKLEFKTELGVLGQGDVDPTQNFHWQHRAALSLQRSGMLELDMGDINASELALDQSMVIITRLLSQDDSSMDWHWDHSNVLFNLGRVYKAKEEYELATNAFNRVISQMSALLQKDNKVAAWQRTQAKARIELASINRIQNRLLVAEQQLQEAINGLEKLQKSAKDSPLIITELARAYIEVGRVNQQVHKPAKAAQAWNQAKEILEPHMTQSEDMTQQLYWVTVLALLDQWEQLKLPWSKLKNMGYRSPEFIKIDKIISNYLETHHEFRPNKNT